MKNDGKDLIVLKNVYPKAGIKIYTQPCKDPQTGRFPDHVKSVDSHGDMILTDAERNDGKVYIPVNKQFILEDGKTFDLTKPYEAADWYAVQFCPIIAQSRDQRDVNGNLVIDGDAHRYGRAELYIERPGYETAKRISRKKKINQAESFIINDDRGPEGHRMKARVFGRDMSGRPDADVEDYLLSIAERDPDKIIDIYTGSDLTIRLLLLDAVGKRVISIKGGLYVYSDTVVIGGSEDAAVQWLKMERNQKTVLLIRRDTYPEYESGNMIITEDDKKQIIESASNGNDIITEQKKGKGLQDKIIKK